MYCSLLRAFALHKLLDKDNFRFLKDVMVNVNPDGTSSVTPPAIITCYCPLDVANFPFDEKNCQLKWGR